MTADTEAMEAARDLLKATLEMVADDGGYCEHTRQCEVVARALLQQREAIIEECAKVADGYIGCDVVARDIRALAARKEPK